jgi:tRNA (cytidine/uridine-2'-O-)-methyltransferase
VLRSPLFHITLHEPEIPNNTGNIGRTCVAAGSRLHLIHPLGFDTSEKACRRAGLDYWPRLGVREHTDWDAYLDAMAREQGHPPRLWLFSAYATRPMFDADFRRGDHLVFGKETAGLPQSLLERHADRLLLLPMVPGGARPERRDGRLCCGLRRDAPAPVPRGGRAGARQPPPRALTGVLGPERPPDRAATRGIEPGCGGRRTKPDEF